MNYWIIPLVLGSFVAGFSAVQLIADPPAKHHYVAEYPRWDDGRQPGPVVLVKNQGAWATPLDSFPNVTACEAKIVALIASADRLGWPRPDGYECRVMPGAVKRRASAVIAGARSPQGAADQA